MVGLCRFTKPVTLAAALLCLSAQSSGQTCAAPTAGDCQNYDNALPANAAYTSNNGYASDIFPGFAICAEEWFCATAGDVTSVCFAGRFNLAPGASAAQDQFSITFYRTLAGAPDISSPIGQFIVGNPTSSFPTSTPGTTLTRSASPLSGLNLTGGRGPGFTWTATLPAGAVTVSQFERIWVEIYHTATPDIDPTGGQRWRWLVYNGNTSGTAPSGNGGCVARATGGTLTGLNTPGDLCLCVNVGMTQPPIPLAPNADCSGAIALTLPANVSADASTARGGTNGGPYCKASPVSGRTYWYSVAGTGNVLEASTCNAGTALDTVIAVYCGSCSGLNCVDSNDTAVVTSPNPPCPGTGDPSRISFATAVGTTYYINVFGFEGAEGAFNLTVTDTGTASSPVPACVSDRCPLDTSGLPGSNFEQEACGVNTNLFCFASNVVQFSLGQTYSGDNPNSDDDWWELMTPAPNVWLELTYNTEAPGFFTAYTGDCVSQLNPGANVLGGNFVGVAAYCDPAVLTFQTDAVGKVRVRSLQLFGRGLDCGPDDDYTFSVVQVATGACCIPATICEAVPRAVCEGNDPPGVYKGDNVACCNGGYPNATDICACRADFNASCGVSVQDIFDFLAAYFAGSPAADVNGSGGAPTVQDIFDYLALYFAGC